MHNLSAVLDFSAVVHSCMVFSYSPQQQFEIFKLLTHRRTFGSKCRVHFNELVYTIVCCIRPQKILEVNYITLCLFGKISNAINFWVWNLSPFGTVRWTLVKSTPIIRLAEILPGFLKYSRMGRRLTNEFDISRSTEWRWYIFFGTDHLSYL